MVAPADPAATGGPGSGDANTRAENERSADALFESRSLDEIREVRARAARDAEAKDEELRQRVGSSYRDAIATADCVLEMEATAARATETLDEAVRVLTALPTAVASIEKGASARAPETRADGTPEGTTSSSSSRDDDALYGAGTRVKFLVDTPEKIWGSLEARDRVGAARRFLAARGVLSVTRAASASGVSREKPSPTTATIGIVARAFPIVEQQAPLLESFRAQISRASRVGLAEIQTNSNANLALDVADALAALVAVENLSAERALRVFLQTRRVWVRAALKRAVQIKSPEDGALGVARALAAVCREARRVPGVLVACFGSPDVLESESSGGFEADLDDDGFEAGATTSRRLRDPSELGLGRFGGLFVPRQHKLDGRRATRAARTRASSAPGGDGGARRLAVGGFRLRDGNRRGGSGRERLFGRAAGRGRSLRKRRGRSLSRRTRRGRVFIRGDIPWRRGSARETARRARARRAPRADPRRGADAPRCAGGCVPRVAGGRRRGCRGGQRVRRHRVARRARRRRATRRDGGGDDDDGKQKLDDARGRRGSGGASNRSERLRAARLGAACERARAALLGAQSRRGGANGPSRLALGVPGGGAARGARARAPKARVPSSRRSAPPRRRACPRPGAAPARLADGALAGEPRAVDRGVRFSRRIRGRRRRRRRRIR